MSSIVTLASKCYAMIGICASVGMPISGVGCQRAAAPAQAFLVERARLLQKSAPLGALTLKVDDVQVGGGGASQQWTVQLNEPLDAYLERLEEQLAEYRCQRAQEQLVCSRKLPSDVWELHVTREGQEDGPTRVRLEFLGRAE